MLAKRLTTGLTLVALFLVVLGADELMAPWFPLWGVTVVLAISACSRELVGLLGATTAKPSGNAVYGGLLVLVAANWLPHVVDQIGRMSHSPGVEVAHDALAPIHVMGWTLWAFVAVVMATFVSQGLQFRHGRATMATISGTVLAIAYLGLLGGFIIQMRWLEGRFHGLVPLATLVAAAKGADTGAYTLGRIAGRHKLWPALSPNKTIEGAVGGLIFGIAFVLAITAIARYILHAGTLSWPAAIGFGVVVSIAAQLGDLMESMIKRDCAQKDASDTLPGFGGVLDVMDSLLFAGPVAYGYWVCFGP
jgi:phosphatidate cytidylyltransferase